jgi:putative transposase
MRKEKLTTGNIYHVFNRGVEKRTLFLDEIDNLRFINNLIIFNDKKIVLNAKYRIKEIEKSDVREPIVDILAFCLMPNHFHLLLSQREDGGISKFMNKIGVGYTNYFNLRHGRVGPLFQGAFKSVLIDKEAQFIHIPYYIHLNPLDLAMPNWKEKGVKDIKKAVDFLENYKWSSHSNYSGKSRFSNIVNKGHLNDIFISSENYRKEFKNFIKNFDFSEVTDLSDY